MVIDFTQSDLERELILIKKINKQIDHLKKTKEEHLKKVREKRREFNENVARG